MLSSSTIIIRDIETISEMREVEELQREVWGCDDRDVVPALTLRPVVEIGGILLGAYDGSALVGFALGFVGCERGRLTIHSDMLGVKPRYRSNNLGYRLKLAQRERAIERNIDTITWTFDPLQSRNAYLNFAKLGVTSDTYKINFYGEETSSFLHRKIGTDRLWVRWSLNSGRVTQRLEDRARSGRAFSELNDVVRLVRFHGDWAPPGSEAPAHGLREKALIEIPARVDLLQEKNPGLALTWRQATRHAFTEAFAAGLVVEEFYRSAMNGQQYGAYLLSARSTMVCLD